MKDKLIEKIKKNYPGMSPFDYHDIAEVVRFKEDLSLASFEKADDLLSEIESYYNQFNVDGGTNLISKLEEVVFHILVEQELLD